MAAESSPTPIRNAALEALAPLVGEWRVEVSNAQFLDGDARLTGSMTATWLDDGAFLVVRSIVDGGPPPSVQVIGRSEDRDEFTVLYADGRGVSRVYAMTFDGGQWRQSRADPGFHQRFHATMSADGRSIDGAWSRSHDDGATWIHDFDLRYIR